jgi:hypothetical protein
MKRYLRSIPILFGRSVAVQRRVLSSTNRTLGLGVRNDVHPTSFCACVGRYLAIGWCPVHGSYPHIDEQVTGTREMGRFVPHWSVMQCTKIGSNCHNGFRWRAYSEEPYAIYDVSIQNSSAQNRTTARQLLSFGDYVDPKGHTSIENTKIY